MKSWKNSFHNARYRCINPKDRKYKYYGGRGIKFLITKEEMASIWTRDNAERMFQPSIDRINGDGNYELSNCRFIEMSENRGDRQPYNIKYRIKQKNKRPDYCLICNVFIKSDYPIAVCYTHKKGVRKMFDIHKGIK